VAPPLRRFAPPAVAAVCDHTFLQRPECYRGKHADPLAAYETALREFVEQTLALPQRPYAVCVRPEEQERVAAWFAAAGWADVRLAVVVGFPLGDRYDGADKAHETRRALDRGAREIDAVMRWGALKAGRDAAVADDLEAVMHAAAPHGALVKVILEVCELSDQEIVRACGICEAAGAQFVKTSTGFGKGGATASALRLMRAHFSRGVKISGGANWRNLGELLGAALGPDDAALDPLRVRIGESSLLPLDAPVEL
jgi:deoxyribose-phosphate aldolase